MAEGPQPVATMARRRPVVIDPDVEYPVALAARVAGRFQVRSPVEALDFAEKGNINQHTFLVRAGRRGEEAEYLLQRINQRVFVRPDRVMAAMIACLDAQRAGLAAGLVPPDAEWEPISLVPTSDGQPYLALTDRRGTTWWRMMTRIGGACSYKSLGEVADPHERLKVAEEAGRGLARFADLTAEMDVAALHNPLPGYRDTRMYFNQLQSVLHGSRSLEAAAAWLPDEEEVRQSTQQHFLQHLSEGEATRRLEDPELAGFIDLAREQQGYALTLADAMAAGRIRVVATHGDTKIENFLFSTRTGEAKALVDLDTIMPQTWLADWGDMVRSLCNVAGERERDLDRVQVDRDIYQALATGYLRTATAVTPDEVALMTDAVQIIALELGVRFLSDYLRGDSYFQLGPADPPDLNKRRAMVQLTLFERLRRFDSEARTCVAGLRPAGNAP